MPFSEVDPDRHRHTEEEDHIIKPPLPCLALPCMIWPVSCPFAFSPIEIGNVNLTLEAKGCNFAAPTPPPTRSQGALYINC